MNAKDSQAVKKQKKQAKKGSTRKPSRQRAAARIRSAVDKTTAGNCKEIAQALVTKAKAGEVQSLKLFYSIAQKAEEGGESEAANRFRSMAMELANSPEWAGAPPAAEEDEDGGKD